MICESQDRHILIVGRNSPGLLRALALLRDGGARVFQVSDLQTCRDALQRDNYDAALIDLGFVAGNGGPELGPLLTVLGALPVVAITDSPHTAGDATLVTRGVQDVLALEDLNAERLDRALAFAQARGRRGQCDTLTGLAGRKPVFERLEQTIEACRETGRSLAVAYIDLDRFQYVNASLGQAAGDRLLCAVADVLAEHLPDGDRVARLGADEFVAIVPDLEEPLDAAAEMQRLAEVLTRSVTVDGRSIQIACSIGIALYPGDGENVDDLVQCAEAAMRDVKRSGGGDYRFYAPDMYADTRERVGLAFDLHEALREDQFVLHYQPQMDLTNGRVVGCEALIRWLNPERGLVPPDQFLPLAEELGMMGRIGEWALGEACRQNTAWQGLGLPAMRIAVNLSAQQFQLDELAAQISAAIAGAGMNVGLLEVELTEGSVMNDVPRTRQTLANLADAGIRVAIDDFGTGYSSLSYLKRFPLHALKIDRSFVNDIQHRDDDAPIVRTVIALARNLGLDVVAEGVESAEQLAFLRENGCDLAQGYFIGRPVPGTEIPGLVRAITSRFSKPEGAGEETGVAFRSARSGNRRTAGTA